MTATGNAVLEFDIARIPLEADALRRVPRSLALRHDILSLSSEGNQLTIALPDVEDREAIDRIRLITGMHVRAFAAPRETIRARLSEVYAEPAAKPIFAGPTSGDSAPAVRALDAVHSAAVETGASDIHVEPLHSGGRVRQRRDGVLLETNAFSTELYAQVVSRIKLLAGMDIADRRQPQDGRYTIEANGRTAEVRVSSMPTIFGEKLVIRLLDQNANLPSLNHLGMSEPDLQAFRKALHAPDGFVVVCGPTGSGKTTTLYAAMAERNVDSQNLCSVEDPVEIRIPGIAQVQVNPRAGLTFASALRAFLRQDPNVIMVGEMRDEETAAVATSAALSGQLVLATLHANDAPKTVGRLFELGVSRHAIASGLTAVIAQRLVRRLCVNCRSAHEVSPEDARDMGISTRACVYRPNGCGACSGTGYSGRIAIFECLFPNDVIRSAIAEGASNVVLRELAKDLGYQPLIADGVRHVRLGNTSLDELRRVLCVQNI